MTEHTRSMRRRTVLAATGGAIASVSGCLGASSSDSTTVTESRRFDVDAGTTVEIDNINGPITVEKADGDELVVDIEKTGSEGALDATTVVTTGNDGRFEIETDHDDSIVSSLFGSGPATVTLAVQCPDGSSVDRVGTTSGDLTVQQVAGPVSMETTNGRIDASDISAIGNVSTTNGQISVDVPALEADTSIESTNGSIEATLGPELDAEVTAQSVNGSVTVEGDLGLSVSDDAVTGVLGDGTHELTVEATNGNITLSEPSG